MRQGRKGKGKIALCKIGGFVVKGWNNKNVFYIFKIFHSGIIVNCERLLQKLCMFTLQPRCSLSGLNVVHTGQNQFFGYQSAIEELETD